MAAQTRARKERVSDENSLYEVFLAICATLGGGMIKSKQAHWVKGGAKRVNGHLGVLASGGSRRPNVGEKVLMLASVVHQPPVLFSC